MNQTTTTTTQKSFRKSNNNNNRKKNKQIQKRVVTVQKVKAPKLKNLVKKVARRVHYYDRYTGGQLQRDMDASVHSLLETQFYPPRGIHRGLTNGLEVSAISYLQGSFEMQTTSANNVLTFAASPGQFAVPTGSGTISLPFISWTNGTDIASPFSAGGSGIVNPVKFAGPFNSSVRTPPHVLARTVSFAMNIIPASNVLNRGGEGKIGYTSSWGTNSVAPFTRNNIDNLLISRAWDGMEAMALHWTPNSSEYAFTEGNDIPQDNADTFVNHSGLLGYVVTVPGAPCVWRVDYQVGIEYLPNNDFKPLVDRKVPLCLDSAVSYLNRIIMQSWSPLMISTYSNYMARVSLFGGLPGGLRETIRLDHAGIGGGFSNPMEVGNASYDVIEPTDEETIAGGFLRSARKGMCNIIGNDICDDPVQALTNRAGQALGSYVGNKYLGRTRAGHSNMILG